MVDFLIDFERYFTVSPKVATLHPFENFRGNRGVRHFNQVLKRYENLLKRRWKMKQKIDAKSMRKSIKKLMIFLDKFSTDFLMIFERFWEAFGLPNRCKNQ